MSARQAKHVIIHLESNRENATYFPPKYTLPKSYSNRMILLAEVCTNLYKLFGGTFLLVELIFDEKILFYKHCITRACDIKAGSCVLAGAAAIILSCAGSRVC